MIALGRKGMVEDNSLLITTIKTAQRWWNYLPNVWIIDTKRNVEEWTSRLNKNNINDTNFIIVDITNSARQGWLPRKAWEWLDKRDGKE